MHLSLIFLGIALIAGLTMAVQGSLNSALGDQIGLWEATFIVHLLATVILFIIVFLLKMGQGGFQELTKVPWYFYLGGLLGVIITYTVVISIPKLGVAVATTAIVVGQVSTACLIDHLGLFGLEQIGFTWMKAVGVVFLALGAGFMLR